MAQDNTNKGFWNKWAKMYTAFMNKNDNAYNELCYHMDLYIDCKKQVLELACGTGQITFRMADSAKSWLATDYSENMLEETKKRNVGDLKCDNLTFEVQDATALSYSDNSFDVVVISNALHIMPHPEKALSEIYRVLKDDGVLLAPTFIYGERMSRFSLWLLEKLDFKSYNKWKKNEFVDFIREHDFDIIGNTTIDAKPLSECMLIAKKSTK